MGQDYLDEVKKAAQKIVGDKATMPRDKGNLQKAYDDIVAAVAVFSSARDKLEDAILDVKKTNEMWIVIADQNKEIFANDDYGLDEKNKDDAKKIKAAQQMCSASFSGSIKVMQQQVKIMDELNKHCIEMAKYKSPKI